MDADDKCYGLIRSHNGSFAKIVICITFSSDILNGEIFWLRLAKNEESKYSVDVSDLLDPSSGHI